MCNMSGPRFPPLLINFLVEALYSSAIGFPTLKIAQYTGVMHERFGIELVQRYILMPLRALHFQADQLLDYTRVFLFLRFKIMMASVPLSVYVHLQFTSTLTPCSKCKYFRVLSKISPERT